MFCGRNFNVAFFFFFFFLFLTSPHYFAKSQYTIEYKDDKIYYVILKYQHTFNALEGLYNNNYNKFYWFKDTGCLQHFRVNWYWEI